MMRMDKFLKAVGLVKRRSIAKLLCDAKRVKLNGRIAKAASDVHVGDVIEIRWGERIVRAHVLKVPDGHIPKGMRNEYVRTSSEWLGFEELEFEALSDE